MDPHMQQRLQATSTLSPAARRSMEAAAAQAAKEAQYNALMSGYTMKANTLGKRRHYDEDDSLEQDDDDECPYQPAPGSPGTSIQEQKDDDNDSDDPLDAFMQGVDAQAKKDKAASEQKACTDVSKEKSDKQKDKFMLGRTDIDGEEAEDMQESYFRFMEERGEPIAGGSDEPEVEYDEDGNVIYTWKKVIDPLPPVDHSTITYQPFKKDFYKVHENIASLSHADQALLRRKLDLTVGGGAPIPSPVCSFAHFNFNARLMAVIKLAEFEKPTPIQAQAIPAALSGRDVIGIAKTGSGKTCAYLWPAIRHIMDQPELAEGDGPIALIIVPTRELAIQVFNEARKYSKVFDLRVVCAYGGGNKYEQSKALSAGAEIVVATPGRLIDLVKINATNLQRVTYLVFDEADRMFDMGFEPQVRSISNHVRPDRQCLLFSATFKRKLENLARDCLSNPVRIVQGEVGEVNADVAQEVIILPSENEDAKFNWLLRHIVQFCAMGKVLIFVTRKDNSVRLHELLKRSGYTSLLLHGDMFQEERNKVLGALRKDEQAKVLVATDVAARGLDIAEIRTVINYDVARDIDTHVHRVGRTGRAGVRGFAFTLLTDKDENFAADLVHSLEEAGQPVTNALIDLAMKSPKFSKERGAFEKQTRRNVGGAGLGYKGPTQKGSMTDTERALSFNTRPKQLAAPKAAPQTASQLPISTSSASSSGNGGGRLEMMRSAFKASFQSKFQRATDSDAPQTETKKRRTRWENE